MHPLLLLLTLPRQTGTLTAVVGLALVGCGFILERAPLGSRWRRLALGLITLTGVGLCWLGAWTAFHAG